MTHIKMRMTHKEKTEYLESLLDKYNINAEVNVYEAPDETWVDILDNPFEEPYSARISRTCSIIEQKAIMHKLVLEIAEEWKKVR